jgi:starvation-inducible DNA-binding protein
MPNRSSESAHKGNGRHHGTHVRNAHGTHATHGAQGTHGALGRRLSELQPYGTLVRYPLGLDDDVCAQSVEDLNAALANTCVLRDMYKKHHWQTSGPTFYQLHLLFDKHYTEQAELVDTLAERVQTLGGLAVAMAHDIVELSQIDRPPRGREDVAAQLTRLLEAHEQILIGTRAAARRASDGGDDGTNDLLVSEVLRTNEMQVWFLSEHLADPGALSSREPR